MSHFVTGLIGSAETLSHFATEHSLHSPRSLAQDLAILPLRERDLESILGVFTTGHVDGFNYLSEQLTEVLCLASIGSQLVFFETEYSGGVGSQGAVLFRDGALAYGPKAAELGPINEALSLLGVCISPPAVDEFEAVGLRAHRSSEAWLDATAPDDC